MDTQWKLFNIKIHFLSLFRNRPCRKKKTQQKKVRFKVFENVFLNLEYKQILK